MLNKIKWRNGDKPFQTKLIWLALLSSPFVGSIHASEFSMEESIMAQQIIKLSGKVVNSNTKQPLSNVSIQVNGKAITSTKADGTFSLDAPSGTDVKFSLIGYESYAEKYSESKNSITIELAESSQDIDEVIVTALGIKRDQKALGYAATELKGEQLTEAISNNWTDALSGKVAGVNLVRSGGGPAGSNKIILRGENNLTGDNNALIVVDGIVVSSSSAQMTGTGHGAYLSGDSPADYGSGLSDINPEDIENITVLKGPNATALYGQRGANGAIIITTKSGKNRKGIGVTVTSNSTIESISRWPDYQYEYGQGVEGANYYSYNSSPDGASTRSTSSAWGPKFDGQMYFQFDPITQTRGTERTPWISYPDARKEFFDTGRTFTNSVTLDGGNDATNMRFSYTNLNNQWIIPNTGYDRNTVSINAAHKVTDKLKIQTRINYKQNKSDNLPSTGYNNQSLMYWNIFWMPNAPLDWLKNYWVNGQENQLQNYPFSSFPDNPYLIAYEMLNKQKRHGLTGNVEVTYEFSKNLNVMARTNLDFGIEKRSQQRPFDTEKFKKGMYRTQSVYNQETGADVMINYKKDIGSDIKTSLSVGGSTIRNERTQERNYADSLAVPGNYTLANAAGIVVTSPLQDQLVLNSWFAMGTFSFKDYLFADFSARNDWNSALATPLRKGNSSFFYPSANLSLILNEIFDLPAAINYFKLRSSVASVGSGGMRAYLTSYTYNPEITFPGGASNPTSIPNMNLEPLRTNSFEIGTDMRLFKSRFNLGLTYYVGNTYNQHLQATTDRSSGYSTILLNAGQIRNSGIEIEGGATLIKKNDFQWKLNGTYAANRNKVIELTDILPNIILQNGPGSRGAIIAYVGGSMGDLYGRGYLRSPNGDIIYENGIPQLGVDMQYIGNTNPKWKGSINNEFRYKQFRASVLFDAQVGAVAYSLTAANLANQGKTKNTLPGRYNGIIGNGVIDNGDGTFRPNDFITENVWDYYTAHLGNDNVEGTSYSTDFLKLREARIDYSFNPKQLQKIGLQRATIGVFGRDLFMWTNWPVFDPEFGTLSGSDINKGFELGQFPSTRTFGLNIVIGI
jgi:TonB-linked SusC/RagA family outer membrane protein